MAIFKPTERRDFIKGLIPFSSGILAVAGVLLLAACGLPDYPSIGKPVVVAAPTSSSLAFATPSDVSNIQGYVLYYKIYTDNTDFDDEEDKSRYFDEYTYININDEMPLGATIPLQRGFIKAGISGLNYYHSFQITDPGIGGSVVYIDFDHLQNRGFSDDSSAIPRVGYVLPPLPDGSVELARGVTDPDFSGPETFLSFVADWDWDYNDAGDEHHDADLYRKTNLPNTSTVQTVMDSLKSDDNPLLKTSISPHTQLLIGFAVYSQGIDPSTLSPLTSKPTYLGTITYKPVNDTNRVRN